MHINLIIIFIFNVNEYRLLINIILALNLHRYLKFREEFSYKSYRKANVIDFYLLND